MPTKRPWPWFPPGFDVGEWNRSARGEHSDSTHHVDAILAALAGRQHGVVSWPQLQYLGITSAEVYRRVRSGHLIRLRRGVYAVGHADVGAAGHRQALVFACGPGARLAGWSGCTHAGLLPQAGAAVDIAIPRRRRAKVPGTNVRRIDARPHELTVTDGVPCHTVPRLLLDLAVHDDTDLLEWAWRQAIFKKALDLRAIEQLLGDHDGAPGSVALRALYARRATLVGELRNRFEVLMLSIIREAGLPEPLCNTSWDVGGGLVLRPDFRIPALRLVIEGDGRDGHEDVESLLSDEERDALYGANDHRTLRVTYWQAKRERGRVVAALQAHRDGLRSGEWNRGDRGA